MQKWAHNIINLIFPETCAGCGRPLLRTENSICLHCLSLLPKRLSLNKEEVNQRFYGRIQLEEAHAFLLFKRKGITQKLLHAMKYGGNQDLAKELGRLFGKGCCEQGFFSTVDVLVPIPLHKSKERFRGYNQSALLAMGMAEVMGKKMDFKSVTRKAKTSTQTRKTRQERWENVERIFSAKEENLKGKHILLVDDVITTGATLESCAQEILNAGAKKISVACLALA